MKRRWLILGILLLVPTVIYGDANRAGGVFLTIFPGAKASAMGAAFSAIADDATASYYNPGALAFFDHPEYAVIHAPWLRGLAPDMYYEFAGFVKPVSDAGAVGGHIIYLTLGEVSATNEEGEEIANFRPYDLAVDLSFGFRFNEELGIGGGVKFIYSFLAPGEVIRTILGEPGGGGSAWSFALDGGVLYRPKRFKGLSLAAALTNLGPGLKYTESGELDPLPRTLRLGIAYTLEYEIHRVTLSADVNKVVVGLFDDIQKQGVRYVITEAWKHVGFEYCLADLISLRVGYFYDHYGYRKGLTFGGGIKFKSLKLDIADDSKIYDFQERLNRRFALTFVGK